MIIEEIDSRENGVLIGVREIETWKFLRESI